jgi:hypothetical protein
MISCTGFDRTHRQGQVMQKPKECSDAQRFELDSLGLHTISGDVGNIDFGLADILLPPAQHTDFCFNVAIPRSKRTGWLLTCW